MDNYINSDYFYDKCIWMIACCDNPKANVSYLFNVFGLNPNRMYDVLSTFLNFSIYSLDDDSRTNLHFLVRFLRNNSDDKDKFNKLEDALYDKSLDCTNGFILNQYEKRFGLSVPISLVDENNKQNSFNHLKSMIVNDVDVLISHSNRCDNVTFNSSKVSEILGDILKYIGSVNMIISEKPEILGDPRFASRVKTVCNVYDSVEKSHNDIVEKTYTMFKNNL